VRPLAEISRLAAFSVATHEFLEEHFPGLEGAVPAMVVWPRATGALLDFFHAHFHSVASLGVF
jgi:hypothetical protein